MLSKMQIAYNVPANNAVFDKLFHKQKLSERIMGKELSGRVEKIWKDIYMLMGEIKAIKGDGQKQRDELSRIIVELQEIKLELDNL
jgi:hypothetical protein